MNSTGSLKLLLLRNKAIHTGGTSSSRSLARKMFDGAWIAGYSYLDCLKSGGVVVGEMLEDVSCSKAKGAQAMQDRRLEAWPKRILNDGTFKYEWDQNTSFDLKSEGKTRVPTKANENIINDKRPPPPLSTVDMEGLSPPIAAKLGSIWRGFQSPLRRYRAACNRRGKRSCLNLYLIYKPLNFLLTDVGLN